MLIALLLACAQDPVRAELEAWALDGVKTTPSAAATQHPDFALARRLGQLAPPWAGGAAMSAAERSVATAEVLEAWLSGAAGEWSGAALSRVRGRLDAPAVTRLEAALRAPAEEGPSLDQIGALLKSAPPDLSAPAMLRIALDPDVHPGLRGEFASTLILLRGRPALRDLAPTLVPTEEDRYLRQVLTAWRQVLEPTDAPLLERIARDGYGSPTQFALQLWGRIERDPARRLAAFELALAAPTGYAHLALDALGSGGPDAVIARRLRESLRVGSTQERSLALRALPLFDSHAAVLEEYRALNRPSVSAAAAWMPVLAQSPLPEARAAAARWLIEGGFGAGAVVQTVLRSLEDAPEVQLILGGLLADPAVPAAVKLPLALAHADSSAEAAEHVRRIAREGSGSDRARALQRLGGMASADDLTWFAEVALGTEFDAATRAVAFAQLMRNGAGAPVLQRWLADPPRDWEVAEAMVRSGIEYGDPEQRRAVLEFGRAGGGFDAPDERWALRAAAWQAAGQRGDPATWAILLEDLRLRLEDTPASGRGAEEPWRDLYQALHEWPEFESLGSAARALGSAGGGPPPGVSLQAWDPLAAAPEALWCAAAAWSGADLGQALDWLDHLDEMPLNEANRVRVRALRAARAREPLRQRAALRALLEQPRWLREYPLILAQSFAPEGVGWSLFRDRLAEREVLADAQCQPPEVARARLALLLEDWIEPESALAAVRVAGELPGGAELALRLAQHGVLLHPLHPEVGAAWAEALEQSGDRTAAREAWAAVERMVPAGFPQHDQAGVRRRALEAAEPDAGGR